MKEGSALKNVWGFNYKEITLWVVILEKQKRVRVMLRRKRQRERRIYKRYLFT